MFLPWHRAYLHYFEQYLRDIDLNLAVPWWNWTSVISQQNGIPKAFSEEKTQDGQPNPLFNSRIQTVFKNVPVDRPSKRFQKPPSLNDNRSLLPSSNKIAKLLEQSNFTDFTKELEQVHSSVHFWFGDGDMNLVAYAAYDPIFFSHHCMIDRIWSLWQSKHGINNIPKGIENSPLPPFNVTVKDVLSISDLGYEYMVDQVVSKSVQVVQKTESNVKK